MHDGLGGRRGHRVPQLLRFYAAPRSLSRGRPPAHGVAAGLGCAAGRQGHSRLRATLPSGGARPRGVLPRLALGGREPPRDQPPAGGGALHRVAQGPRHDAPLPASSHGDAPHPTARRGHLADIRPVERPRRPRLRPHYEYGDSDLGAGAGLSRQCSGDYGYGYGDGDGKSTSEAESDGRRVGAHVRRHDHDHHHDDYYDHHQ
mmetsp:Transcript_16157/g.42385  ORF Transcript_16157/g.42385 Transcript_16157/m.42385 type:complete len:203 (+) Transcript_16157:190-798(+)